MSDSVIALGTKQTGAEEFGHSIIVPVNPQSHLMYYLSCVNTVLKPKGEQTDVEMRKLCDYKNYTRLTQSEIDRLILMCFLLSPDVLLNKCVFVCDDLCKDYDNNFYEINEVSRRFVISRELLIGGERREVRRIMTCRLCWLQQNWFTPMEHYKQRLLRITAPSSERDRRPTTATQSVAPSGGRRARPSSSQPSSSQNQQNNSWCSIS